MKNKNKEPVITETPPETASLSPSPSASDAIAPDAIAGGAIDNSHITQALLTLEADEARAAREEAEKAKAEAVAEAVKAMPKAEFCGIMSGVLNAAQIMTGYQSLKIEGERQKAATAAYEALYEMILDSASLRWMLNPQSRRAMQVYTVGVFFVPLAYSVAVECRARKLAAQRPEVKMEKPDGKAEYVPDFAAAARQDAEDRARAVA